MLNSHTLFPDYEIFYPQQGGKDLPLQRGRCKFDQVDWNNFNKLFSVRRFD
jgi:hypothetical protein